MHIYVVAVSGLVQVRQAEDQPWFVASTNMVLSEGAELRTGPHSSVTCVIPPDQTFTLDRLGTVRVADAFRNGNKVKTDLLMKYGRTHYEIQSAGLEHEASITSPSSTLAVRGTTVSLYDQPPFVPLAISYTGRAVHLQPQHRQRRNQTWNIGQSPCRYRWLRPDRGWRYGRRSPLCRVSDRHGLPASRHRSRPRRRHFLQPDFRNPRRLRRSAGLRLRAPQSLPGTLDFVLRWTGNADLNLEVGVDAGDPQVVFLSQFTKTEFLYPGYGMQNSPSGGHIPYDDIGGPTGGEEIAYWLGSHPTGLYGIGAQFVSGAPTSYTFNIYEYGQPVEMFYFDANGDFVKSIQMTSTLSSGQFGQRHRRHPRPILLRRTRS